MHVGRQVLMVHKAFLKRKRPLYSKRQEAIAEVPDFWLKVVSHTSTTYEYALLCSEAGGWNGDSKGSQARPTVR